MKKLFLLLLILPIISCNPEGRVFKEYQELSPQFEWLKKDKKTFAFSINDTTSLYNISIPFRFSTGYQFQIAKIILEETNPSGKKTISDYELQIRNEKGEYMGEPGYDIWDSEHLILANRKFDAIGEYTIVMSQDMPTDPLNYALEIGLIVDKVLTK